jgi:altronate dehydratase large subunit
VSDLEVFLRADGRAGLRDHVLVLSAVALANRWAALVAEGTDAVVVAGEALRGLRGGDAEALDALVLSLARHPNVGAALVLTQDAVAARRLETALGDAGKPVAVLALLEQDGMTAAVEAGREALRDLAADRRPVRERAGLGALTLALECGGSDPTSALASNAAIGRFVDRVVDAGGSAVVSETVEFIGAEPVVDARTDDPAVRAAIRRRIAARERWHAEDGEDYRGVNPTAENIAGGLTTLVEKSMGAVAKTGTRPFVGALGYGQAPAGPGLHFMDTAFFTPLSLTGMVAAGANLVLFGLGQFNPSGCPLAPTVKVCGNALTTARWRDGIDIDASAILSGTASLDDVADRIASFLARVASGTPTAAECWGEGQIIMPRNHAPL